MTDKRYGFSDEREIFHGIENGMRVMPVNGMHILVWIVWQVWLMATAGRILGICFNLRVVVKRRNEK